MVETRRGEVRVLAKQQCPHRKWQFIANPTRAGLGNLIPLYVGYDLDLVRRKLQALNPD